MCYVRIQTCMYVYQHMKSFSEGAKFHLQAYLFNDYWEDIGTIKSFFEANLALTEHVSCFLYFY